MKIALMCYKYILENLEIDIKPAQFLLTASFLYVLCKGTKILGSIW